MSELDDENEFEQEAEVKKLEQDYEIEDQELEREYEVEEYIKLLPAWFTLRMLDDTWSFGLLIITGDIIAIECINSIKKDASGNLWLDATLKNDCLVNEIFGHRIFLSPTPRNKISINTSHIIAAFELAGK